MAQGPTSVPYIRRAVLEMPPRPDPPTEGLLRHAGRDTGKILPMGLNECLLPPSPRVLDAIRSNAASINRYPDAQCPALSDVIAARTGVPIPRIIWGNGSEELIQGAIAFSAREGDRIVLPVPTFWGYRAIIRASGASMVEVENLDDGMPDVQGIIARSKQGARIAFCITPNNPSGAMLSRQDLEKLAAEVPEDCLLFIDEAYHEFGAHAGGPDVLAALAKRNGPWIVARTFSKAYAMAGMRIGYALCGSDALANALKNTTCVFNVPVLAQAAALAALDDKAHLTWILDSIAAGRAQLDAGLRALGLAPLSSVGNFVSVRLPIAGPAAVKAMLAHGVQINAWADTGYENFIRITVGDAAMNATCLAMLAIVLEQARQTGNTGYI
ncbi:MAG: pyridoxal phosphate-dependent aminotransferase [Burkholderiales bacterium]